MTWIILMNFIIIIEHSFYLNEFHRKIILSDEAHYHLGGFVNNQNCRNYRVIVEKPLYPQRVFVWCGLWSSGVTGPFFFENEVGATVTVNGLRYREMIKDFLWPKLDSIDLDNVYFRQEQEQRNHLSFGVKVSGPCNLQKRLLQLVTEIL